MGLRADRERTLYYCRGLVVLLQECANGRNIHKVGNLGQVLKNWIHIIERGASQYTMDRIAEGLPDVAERIREEHRVWWETHKRRHGT